MRPLPLTFGSWYFAPDTEEALEFSQSEYFEVVRRCLAGIEGVRDVAIDLSDDERSEKFVVEPAAPDPERAYVGPHWGYAWVEFAIDLPSERQASVEGTRLHEGFGEQFGIRMAYGWQVPVSMVTVLDAPDAAPTSASRVVYRYLRREVQRSAEPLVLACIPPIFTHADFWLVPGAADAPSEGYVRREYSRPAYHRYVFEYSPPDDPTTADSFFFEMQSELDVYYRSQDADRSEGLAWMAVSDDVETLTEPRGERSWLDRVKDRLSRGVRIRRAASALTRFAAQRQLVRSQLTRNAQSLYAPGGAGLARELIEDELDDCVEYPIEQFSRLVEMFDSGRLVELQVAVVIIATVVGAIIGAAATLIAS